jgi:hypothetical protein
MTPSTRNVKARLSDWFVCHPLTGWYIALICGANFVLNLLDLLMNAFS